MTMTIYYYIYEMIVIVIVDLIFFACFEIIIIAINHFNKPFLTFDI